ncbi:MAG: hypothetical protein FWF25_08435, partial [Propionibacteriaceae bacterium]|nr:hypothetical protein [Propionibacteriaceae bacterium]
MSKIRCFTVRSRQAGPASVGFLAALVLVFGMVTQGQYAVADDGTGPGAQTVTVTTQASVLAPLGYYFPLFTPVTTSEDHIGYNVTVTNQTSAVQDVTVNLAVTNQDGAAVFTSSDGGSVAAGVGQTKGFGYTIGMLPNGSYTFVASAKVGDAIEDTQTYRLGVLQSLTGVDPTFTGLGANTGDDYNLGYFGMLQLCRGTGVTAARMVVPWDVVETTPGAYNFTTTSSLNDAVRCGQAPLIVLGLNNDAVYPDRYSDAWLTAFQNYAQQTAEQYKGITHDYEVWDEFNAAGSGDTSPATYYKILKAAYQGVKAADPDAIVIAGSTAPAGDHIANYDFIRQVAAQGAAGTEGWRYMDGVSYHYPALATFIPEAATLQQDIVAQATSSTGD